MSNKFLMHYGCKTATGQFMHTTYSLLFVKLGLSFQPLQESYMQFGYLATYSWLKMSWEKASMFDIKVVVVDFMTKFPRKGNQFIMQILIA
jgi:hypothetical protein